MTVAPWNASEFRKHFKKAKGKQASKAASVASAMIRGGADEGVAIATGIARAKGKKRKARKLPEARA